MGKTIPPFRIVLEMEKQDWKPFRNVLGNQKEESLTNCFIFLLLEAALMLLRRLNNFVYSALIA
jgi:hypothetical protein